MYPTFLFLLIKNLESLDFEDFVPENIREMGAHNMPYWSLEESYFEYFKIWKNVNENFNDLKFNAKIKLTEYLWWKIWVNQHLSILHHYSREIQEEIEEKSSINRSSLLNLSKKLDDNIEILQKQSIYEKNSHKAILFTL
jgi:hypothetical protein